MIEHKRRGACSFAGASPVLFLLAILMMEGVSMSPALAAGAARAVSTLAPREHLVLFPTAAALDVQTQQWRIPLHAWVYVPQRSTVRKAAVALLLERAHGLELTPAARPHFDARVNLLLADNKRRRRVVVMIAGESFNLPPTTANGHTTFEVRLSAVKAAAAARDGHLTVEAVLPTGDDRRFTGDVRLLPLQGMTVISDIDDTVKVTHVTDRQQLWRNTFFEPFAPVPGMATLYRRLGASQEGASLHFVSSSPWHLYAPLSRFLAQAGFPTATMDLKTMRLKDRSILNILKSPEETKPPQIEAMLARFPARQFILVGDSGERDPEIYADIWRRHPQRIARILIRNVTGARTDDPRFSSAFAGIDPAHWQIFTDPAEVRAP